MKRFLNCFAPRAESFMVGAAKCIPENIDTFWEGARIRSGWQKRLREQVMATNQRSDWPLARPEWLWVWLACTGNVTVDGLPTHRVTSRAARVTIGCQGE